MNINEKQEFFEVFKKCGELYDKIVKPERVAVYWDALSHRTIADIKSAINRHVQDSERGRFFPLPADITAQLPKELNAWLTANEAWATCPKDEYKSAAMCEEIGNALGVAQDLINDGDMIAARMAFIEHYNRLVEQAKMEGRKPEWFTSYGFDKETRYLADKQLIEYKNLALPEGSKLSLPEPENVKSIEFKDLLKLEVDHNPERTKEINLKHMIELKKILKK